MERKSKILNLYSEINKSLIPILRRNGAIFCADALHYRLHEKTWTTSAELLEELLSVVQIAIQELKTEPLEEGVLEQLLLMKRRMDTIWMFLRRN